MSIRNHPSAFRNQNLHPFSIKISARTMLETTVTPHNSLPNHLPKCRLSPVHRWVHCAPIAPARMGMSHSGRSCVFGLTKAFDRITFFRRLSIPGAQSGRFAARFLRASSHACRFVTSSAYPDAASRSLRVALCGAAAEKRMFASRKTRTYLRLFLDRWASSAASAASNSATRESEYISMGKATAGLRRTPWSKASAITTPPLSRPSFFLIGMGRVRLPRLLIWMVEEGMRSPRLGEMLNYCNSNIQEIGRDVKRIRKQEGNTGDQATDRAWRFDIE